MCFIKRNELKAKVTISRNSNDEVYIFIKDVASGSVFAEVCMSVENYGYLVTGLAAQEGELRVRDLEFVGKKKIIEQRQKVCPLDTYSRPILEEWLKNNAKEEGWTVNTYLGGQKSICEYNGSKLLHYSVYKYVDEGELNASID